MTSRERAETWVAEVETHRRIYGREALVDSLTGQFDTAVREALEEAARVLESRSLVDTSDVLLARRLIREQAAAVRALMPGEKP